jgi:pantetheine-phosphate adenylyltransferase
MPGSFDPFTIGHLDILRRALALFDEIIIAVGVNSGKRTLLTVTQRLEVIRQATAEFDTVSVAEMPGLLVDFCRDHGAAVSVRGVRSGGDFETEWGMAAMNTSLGLVETVLLPASATVGFISSTLVRSVAQAGGDVTPYVPASVAELVRHLMQKEL